MLPQTDVTTVAESDVAIAGPIEAEAPPVVVLADAGLGPLGGLPGALRHRRIALGAARTFLRMRRVERHYRSYPEDEGELAAWRARLARLDPEAGVPAWP